MFPVLQERLSAYGGVSSLLTLGKVVSPPDEEGGKIFLYVNIIFLEFPFFLFLSLFCFFPLIKNRIVKYLFPIINVAIFYLSCDIIYHFHDRYPQPSDLKNINTVLDFSPLFSFIIFFSLVIIPVGSVVTLVWYAAKAYNKTTLVVSCFSRFMVFLVVVMVMSSSVFADYYIKIFNFVYWSPALTVRRNGRLATFLYYGIKERQCKELLITYKQKNIDIHKILYPDFDVADASKLKNIHLVVLESFIDPRLLQNVQFNRSPLADELIPFMNKGGNFSLVESPVYGGRTAQAEFELLTGIRALAKVDSVEFNVMTGGSASSFVQRLKDYNYQAIATIASSSVYFNERRAYKSLGFNEVSFLAEENEFKNSGYHNHPIFDGDVFQHNLKKIRSLLSNSKGPLFNYVVGLYGHIPYVKVDKHRDVISSSRSDGNINKISNQFYYRTKALAGYLGEINKIDPDS